MDALQLLPLPEDYDRTKLPINLQTLQRFAKLGSSGTVLGNCYRDLMRQLSVSLFKCVYFPVPLVKNDTWEIQSVGFLLPHVVFSTIYSSCKGMWEKVICPSREALRSFWQSQEGNPALKDHPIKQVPNWMTRAVPLGFHGDHVPTVGCGKAWAKLMIVLSWSSVFGSGSTLEQNYLMWAHFWHNCYHGEGLGNTMTQVWKILAWSFYWLFMGLWPTHDYDNNALTDDPKAGTPLCPHADHDMCFLGVLWVIKGDLDYFFQVSPGDYKGGG